MKRSLIFLVIMICISSFFACYAVQSGEDSSGDNTIYLDSLDQYEQITNDKAKEDENEQLRQMYEEYKKSIVDYYESYERPQTVRAKVVKASASNVEYNVSNYYSISRLCTQDVTLEVLEGDYKGKEIEAKYVRTGDSLDNIHFAEIKEGDIVFVSVEESGGELTASFSNSWASVSRNGVVYILIALAIILLMVYAGKKGLNAGLISIIAGLFSVIVITDFAFNGMSIALAGLLYVLALVVSISFAHLKVSKLAFKSMLVSLIAIAICVVLVVFTGFVSRTAGTTIETAVVGESIILNEIKFETLYYVITLAIGAGFITNTVCQLVSKIERECAQTFEERLELGKSVILSNITLLSITLLALYIPNHLLLLSNKLSATEISNAEPFVVEILRVVNIAISVILCAPLVSFDKWGFGKKCLPEKNEVKNEQ